MKPTHFFQPKKLALSVSLAMGVAGTVAMAQDVETADGEERMLEEVVVTGYRKSLIDSIDNKRYDSSIIESISAEDIGKLPDVSIAESLARLPGLAAQRLDGRASRISIRGFGENESATTFNGREQVSISDNRGVEFDLYPSEIMSAVNVYKTPRASLEAEGIAGVIDMRTVKPLDTNARFQIKGEYEYNSLGKLNPDADDTGVNATFSLIQQFADNTVGIALAHATMDSPNQENRWNAWGYPGGVLGGAKPFVRSSTLERDSTMLVVQFEPNERLSMTADALYVDFADEKLLRGIEIPFAWGQGAVTADAPDANGVVKGGTTVGQRVVVRNDYEERKAELTSMGFNLVFDLSDDLQIEFDASRSEVQREIYSFESYSGTGRGNDRGVADTISYSLKGGASGAVFSPGLDYSDTSLIQLGGPLTWGWQSTLNDKFGATGTEFENTAQDGFLNAPNIDDELTALKLAAKQQLSMGPVTDIEYGVSFRDRTKEKTAENYFMTLNVFPEMLAIPDKYNLGSVNLNFIGMGNMVAYDSIAMVRDGFYDLTLEESSYATNQWSVSEEVTAFYAMANLEMDIAGKEVSGNVGVRYLQTDQSSTAFARSGSDLIRQTVSHDYNNVLPSLNLRMALDEQQTIRFGIAKTMSRPRMDEMNASFGIGISQVPDVNGNYISAGGGNTSLEPKEALGIDLTYENYFADDGYFAIALYRKELKEWIFDGAAEIDVSNFLAATGQTTPDGSTTATVNGKVNGGDGTLSGWEVSLAMPLSMIHESLEGWGIFASHTGVSSDIKTPSGAEYELPGLSKSIQQATVYYENGGFEARLSVRKRDDFKGDLYGLGFSVDQYDMLGETIADAQISYDFADSGIAYLEGLRVYLQGVNLTDEPFTSLSGGVVRDYQEYGENYRLGFSYDF
ncbi:TonB-dependent receptor [Aequoribacter fuscus]|jgi:iron complex outermembrane receptor protein|uniref:TonB-dependent receptor n=1 Tax=Aequoribacter fuscus TaxID=2518989 RepID=UPI001362B97F|nr:TonB-dependent receptor [Aequoribacter fuscus]QHJ88514.1 TonB-dependent receptor [Aequoribacter fuscus]